MTSLFAIFGSIFGAISVGMGAFGAHGLKGKVDERMLDVWATAAQYNMTHALALFAAAWVASRTEEHIMSQVAGWAFVAGILLFSGSLYAMVLTGKTKLGAITPIGGVAFIIGWIALAIAASGLHTLDV